jgi:ketosteroid isomerase-like protein
MRPHVVLASFALISTVVAACAQPNAQAASLSDADKATNSAMLDAFSKGVLASDFASVAALYSDDAMFMPHNEPTVRGRANIQKWMSAFPKINTFALIDHEVDGSGNVAYVTGRYKMSFTPPGAKAPVVDSGKFMEVHRKQADGKWLMVRDIFNSDVPMAPAPAAPATKAAPAK